MTLKRFGRRNTSGASNTSAFDNLMIRKEKTLPDHDPPRTEVVPEHRTGGKVYSAG